MVRLNIIDYRAMAHETPGRGARRRRADAVQAANRSLGRSLARLLYFAAMIGALASIYFHLNACFGDPVVAILLTLLVAVAFLPLVAHGGATASPRKRR